MMAYDVLPFGCCQISNLCRANRAEKYLQEVWPEVTRALKPHGIKCELNLVSEYARGKSFLLLRKWSTAVLNFTLRRKGSTEAVGAHEQCHGRRSFLLVPGE